MIMVTDAWLAQMEESTDYVETVIITLADSTQITLGRDDLRFGDSITSGSESNSVPIGEAVCKTCTIHIDNSDGTYDNTNFLGASIVVKVSMYLTEMEWTEEIILGTFYVAEPQETGTVIEVTGVDAMHKADKPFAVPQTLPITAATLYQNACTQAGLQYNTLTFYNYDFVINAVPTGLTCRQVIGYIAMIACGNAVINTDNRVDIITYYFPDPEDYPDDWVYPVFKNWVQPPNLYANDITITGVKTVVTSPTGEETTYTQGTDDYVVVISNPLITGKEQDVVDDIWSTIAGISFFPFSGSHTGYPMAEFMDSCIVVDVKGGIHYSFVTQFEFTFLSTTQISNTLPPPIIQNSSIPSESSQVERKTHEAIKTEVTRIDTAIANINTRISGMSGMYITEVTQPGGGVVIYQHDKPSLAESQKIWMETAETRAVSMDGGQTWVAGVTADGQAIVRHLAAEGVSASWIDAGTLQISNGDGDVLFYASIDTGVVRIAGWNATDTMLSSGTLGQDNSFFLATQNLGTATIAGVTLDTWRLAVGSSLGITASGILCCDRVRLSGVIRTEDSTIGRFAEMNGGEVYFGKIDENGNDVLTGGITRIAWGGDYEDKEGIMFTPTSNAAYLVIAHNRGSGWGASIIINNSLNPRGYTQDTLFWQTTLFRTTATFDAGIDLTYDGLIKTRIRRLNLNDGTTDRQVQGIFANNYGLVMGYHPNHNSDDNDRVVCFIINNGCNYNGKTQKIQLLGTTYVGGHTTLNAPFDIQENGATSTTLRHVGVSDGTTSRRTTALFTNNYGLIWGFYANHDQETGSGTWTTGLLLNNGCNRDGITQKVQVLVTAYFAGHTVINAPMDFQESGATSQTWRYVGMSDGTTSRRVTTLLTNNYGFTLGRYPGHDQPSSGTWEHAYVLNNGSNWNGITHIHQLYGSVYLNSGTLKFRNVDITQYTSSDIEAIKLDCRVQIGDLNPIQGYKVRIAAVNSSTAGSIYAEGAISCTSLTQRSDEKLKNITEYDDRYTDVLDELEPINFTWKDLKGDREHVGLGARQTKAILDAAGLTNSGLVQVEPDIDEYSINYSELTVMLLAKVQKQQKTIEELENRINRLETLLEGLL